MDKVEVVIPTWRIVVECEKTAIAEFLVRAINAAIAVQMVCNQYTPEGVVDIKRIDCQLVDGNVVEIRPEFHIHKEM
jgi:hypothetical protein